MVDITRTLSNDDYLNDDIDFDFFDNPGGVENGTKNDGATRRETTDDSAKVMSPSPRARRSARTKTVEVDLKCRGSGRRSQSSTRSDSGHGQSDESTGSVRSTTNSTRSTTRGSGAVSDTEVDYDTEEDFEHDSGDSDSGDAATYLCSSSSAVSSSESDSTDSVADTTDSEVDTPSPRKRLVSTTPRETRKKRIQFAESGPRTMRPPKNKERQKLHRREAPPGSTTRKDAMNMQFLMAAVLDMDKASRSGLTSSRTSVSSRSSSRMISPSPRVRKNQSFSNDQVRRIDRENQRLLSALSKISAKRTPHNTHKTDTRSRCQIITSAYLNRKKEQRRIELENLALLKRLNTVKPSRSVQQAEHRKSYATQPYYPKAGRPQVRHFVPSAETSAFGPQWKKTINKPPWVV